MRSCLLFDDTNAAKKAVLCCLLLTLIIWLKRHKKFISSFYSSKSFNANVSDTSYQSTITVSPPAPPRGSWGDWFESIRCEPHWGPLLWTHIFCTTDRFDNWLNCCILDQILYFELYFQWNSLSYWFQGIAKLPKFMNTILNSRFRVPKSHSCPVTLGLTPSVTEQNKTILANIVSKKGRDWLFSFRY